MEPRRSRDCWNRGWRQNSVCKKDRMYRFLSTNSRITDYAENRGTSDTVHGRSIFLFGLLLLVGVYVATTKLASTYSFDTSVFSRMSKILIHILFAILTSLYRGLIAGSIILILLIVLLAVYYFVRKQQNKEIGPEETLYP